MANTAPVGGPFRNAHFPRPALLAIASSKRGGRCAAKVRREFATDLATGERIDPCFKRRAPETSLSGAGLFHLLAEKRFDRMLIEDLATRRQSGRSGRLVFDTVLDES